jgi:hypothetical protein
MYGTGPHPDSILFGERVLRLGQIEISAATSSSQRCENYRSPPIGLTVARP